ncbi:MAG TPA: hypothetical protein VIT92_08950 [Burkholderiaceae bacterium]
MTTTTPEQAQADPIEWARDLEQRLIQTGEDEGGSVQNLMAEAACLISLLSRPPANGAAAQEAAIADPELAKLKELAMAATPGEWHWGKDTLENSFADYLWSDGGRTAVINRCHAPDEPEAAYIAAANPATMLSLIASIEGREQAIVDAARDELPDERAKFIAYQRKRDGIPDYIGGEMIMAGEIVGYEWEGWQARASIAAGSKTDVTGQSDAQFGAPSRNIPGNPAYDSEQRERNAAIRARLDAMPVVDVDLAQLQALGQAGGRDELP